MTPAQFLDDIIIPGLERLRGLGGPPISFEAKRMLLAIAMQEVGASLEARYQHSPAASPGPARGFWQFEQGGGVAGVLAHHASRTWAKALCEHCVVVGSPAAVWRALEGHDDLATGFARLLLWTDPRALPVTEQDGWDCYMRNWRPGKPHPARWPDHWRRAHAAVAVGSSGV